MTDRVRVTRGGADWIDALEPVYRTLHAHHAAIAPDLAGHPARSPAEAWRLRSARYQQWLSSPGSFVMLARRGEALLGYVLVSVGPGMQGWATGARIGDIHDIAVIPSERNRGLGASLLDAAEHELAKMGIGDCRLSVLAANEAARKLYERRGMTVMIHVMSGPVRGGPR